MPTQKHDAKEELDHNTDPIDTPIEAEVNSKTIGPIDTAAEIRRFLDEQRKRGVDDTPDNPEETSSPHP